MTTVFDAAYTHLNTILNNIQHDPAKPPTVLLGLSGGADSVFLFHLLLHAQKNNKLTFHAAHMNHEWRTDADKTVEFCEKLCQENEIPLTVHTLKDYEAEVKDTGSKEDFARRARLLFFKTLAEEKGIQWWTTAHHADDQIETFFIKLIRGATLDGLTGMRTVAPSSIRPLLPFSKNALLHYLKENNIEWHHDYTNDQDDHLRNRVRNSIIPSFIAADERGPANVLRFQALANLDNDFLQQMTLHAEKRITCDLTDKIGVTAYSLAAFMQEHPAIQNRLFAHLLYKHQFEGIVSERVILEIMRFLFQSKGGVHTVKNLAIHKKDETFWFE